jgi:hypothetical protein
VSAAACGDPPGADDDDSDAAVNVPDAATSDAAPPDAPTFDAGPDALAGPDLTVNGRRLRADLAIEDQFFEADACELDPDEDCIGAAGDRRLLRFSVETPNIGLEDLYLGPPNPGNPNFVFSSCHGHYHFQGYAEYFLEDSEGTLVAPGQKQAFCLLDWHKYLIDDDTVNDSGSYGCNNQGIQRGWSDVYEARLPCQYIDITGVPDGDYTLRIEINAARGLEEMSYDNNSVTVPVTIGDPVLEDPTEACDGDLDPLSADGLHRECGWTHAGMFACTPGAKFRAGCAAGCGLGTCTGDPILRVCDAADPDGNCTAVENIADDDDSSCGGQCPHIFNADCPAGGSVDVFTAPYALGDAYTCVVELD